AASRPQVSWTTRLGDGGSARSGCPGAGRCALLGGGDLPDVHDVRLAVCGGAEGKAAAGARRKGVQLAGRPLLWESSCPAGSHGGRCLSGCRRWVLARAGPGREDAGSVRDRCSSSTRSGKTEGEGKGQGQGQGEGEGEGATGAAGGAGQHGPLRARRGRGVGRGRGPVRHQGAREGHRAALPGHQRLLRAVRDPGQEAPGLHQDGQEGRARPGHAAPRRALRGGPVREAGDAAVEGLGHRPLV
ncbi:unnamed protein product, partial [Prorocentrum cordatum]